MFLGDLDTRSRDVFRRLVETYLETGDPVGSRTISRTLPDRLSPASIRNVMSDLESLGLISAPHVSAGRLPTELGLRLFVDGLLEFGDLTSEERAKIDIGATARGDARSIEDVLTEASNRLSGLSQCAGVVVTPKLKMRLKHLQFVSLDANRALAVLVGTDGSVENRIVDLPPGLPASTLVQATNYLNARITNHSIEDVRDEVLSEIESQRSELDSLTARVVAAGLAVWAGDDEDDGKTLIVRGRANLLDEQSALDDLERIRLLFDDLESKKELISLLGLAEQGEGVKIFIGSENKLFSLSGSSLVVAPYRDREEKIVGVLGVIGPTRLNYARIVPMVDYTAQVISRVLA